MGLAALLILGFGPLNWVFPWWVWVLVIICGNPVVNCKND